MTDPSPADGPAASSPWAATGRPAAVSRRRFLGMGAGLASLWAMGCLAPPPRPGLTPGRRLRLRDLGIVLGDLSPGPRNAITDVPGVRVGHVTLVRGDGPLVPGQGPVRTGVTALLAHGGNLAREPVWAADRTLNGNGELTGVGYLRSTGLLAAPILFTDTASVGAVYHGALGYLLEREPALFALEPHPEPVVGETWGGFLNDTAGLHVRAEHAVQALASASDGPVPEGSVGGGTAMRAFGFKAGIGTASRRVACADREYTLGVLVQANFGSRGQLRVDGVPVGRLIGGLMPEEGASAGTSLLAAVATDAPLLPVQLRRLCQRVGLGMARTGGVSAHGSGDLAVAFSTGQRFPLGRGMRLEVLADAQITRLHEATVEATEEAILNALTAASTMRGRDGNTIHALPLERLVEVMQAHGRLK
ncbi:MAG: P1 family peptidase [Candidatus Latescibacterota bacterium]